MGRAVPPFHYLVARFGGSRDRGGLGERRGAHRAVRAGERHLTLGVREGPRVEQRLGLVGVPQLGAALLDARAPARAAAHLLVGDGLALDHLGGVEPRDDAPALGAHDPLFALDLAVLDALASDARRPDSAPSRCR